MKSTLCNSKVSKQGIKNKEDRNEYIYSYTTNSLETECILCRLVAFNVKSKSSKESNPENPKNKYKKCTESAN